jgi:hypothetical protein
MTTIFQVKDFVEPVDIRNTLWKFGFNADIAGSYETVWDIGGTYSWPAAAAKVSVSSNDTDDAAAGDGARTVTIYGLDANYHPISEQVTMSGVSLPLTSAEFLRVNRIIVNESGNSGTNEGTIYVGTGVSATTTASGSGTPAAVWAAVLPTNGQTLMAIWTVPAEHNFFLSSLFVNSSLGGAANKTLTCRLMMRPEGGSWNIKDKFTTALSSVTIKHDFPVKVAPKTDIMVEALTGGTYDVSAAFEGILD